uniref:50S ribosomal protein L9 n=1 Tax=Jaagichlorella roystonensis TaxID=1052852 RepID=A0A6C0M5S9_9CHLO|nr:50S ribosomal protein L9 [Jaagichlorella roystonensis]YP_009733046.1 50S ribosomal protein L9 [Jaagichlorella roystonensis]QHU78298.1 50S ribosomal protein L9 [Jaagichlorella roystonensis]QHU78342.1 50S ribosomal protein L9 [Jaagichlorella roystonensis]
MMHRCVTTIDHGSAMMHHSRGEIDLSSGVMYCCVTTIDQGSAMVYPSREEIDLSSSGGVMLCCVTTIDYEEAMHHGGAMIDRCYTTMHHSSRGGVIDPSSRGMHHLINQVIDQNFALMHH